MTSYRRWSEVMGEGKLGQGGGRPQVEGGRGCREGIGGARLVERARVMDGGRDMGGDGADLWTTLASLAFVRFRNPFY
jgi:hypothetical protein